jgi:hypothetical protein
MLDAATPEGMKRVIQEQGKELQELRRLRQNMRPDEIKEELEKAMVSIMKVQKILQHANVI